jgi:hypothetical protein
MSDEQPNSADLAEALQGDPAADDEGTLGVRDTRDLGDLAARVGEIGAASHSAFGDRIVALADQLGDLAAEARRRLAPEAGTPDDLLPEP